MRKNHESDRQHSRWQWIHLALEVLRHVKTAPYSFTVLRHHSRAILFSAGRTHSARPLQYAFFVYLSHFPSHHKGFSVPTQLQKFAVFRFHHDSGISPALVGGWWYFQT